MAAVSIIIPVYDTEGTLARCLDSALAQTFADVEVVVVDDGSPDRAGELADGYAARDSRVRVIHQVNAGLAEARRAGIRAARGEYIVPLDSDDALPPQAVALLYERVTAHGLDIAFGAYNRVFGTRSSVFTHPVEGVLAGEAYLDHLLSLGCRCAAGFSISRRSLWRDEVFPPASVRLPSEDVLMNIFASQWVERAGIFNDIVVYDYHFNPRSLSIAGTLHRQALWREYFALLRSNLSARGVLERHERQVRMLEVDRLGFLTADVDASDPWLRRVAAYPDDSFPLKTRVLQRLLPRPRLLRFCVAANRRLKRLLGKRQ